MDYQQEYIIDFARRTRENLEYIEQAHANGAKVYEVTQLCNSLLGLLVFPREYYMQSIPETPLGDLVEQGWPDIRTTHGELPQDDLRSLMQMLRNSIAHCNVEFCADDAGEIRGLKLWNRRGRTTTWKAELTLNDLRTIALKFIELIESEGVS